MYHYTFDFILIKTFLKSNLILIAKYSKNIIFKILLILIIYNTWVGAMPNIAFSLIMKKVFWLIKIIKNNTKEAIF